MKLQIPKTHTDICYLKLYILKTKFALFFPILGPHQQCFMWQGLQGPNVILGIKLRVPVASKA